MPMRPLDLQVNFNTLLEVTRHEGNRHLRDDVRQRLTEQKIMENADKKNNRVTESAQVEVRSDIEDTHRRFGNTTEQERAVHDYIEKQNSRQKKEQQNHDNAAKQEDSEKNNQKSDSLNSGGSDDHLIDFLA